MLPWDYSTAGIAGVVLVVFYLAFQRVQDYARTRHIPGPFWAGWTDLWMIRMQLGGRMCFELADANKTYGELTKFPSCHPAEHPPDSRLQVLSQRSRQSGWCVATAPS